MTKQQSERMRALIDAQAGLYDLLSMDDAPDQIGQLNLITDAVDGAFARLPADITRELAELALKRARSELEELMRAASGDLPRGAEVTS